MKKNSARIAVTCIFIFLSSWWLWANLSNNDGQKELFSDSYWVLPLVSGIIGLFAAKKWGGIKSVFGKAVTFLSLGLLAQVFGQVVYSYYAHVQHVEAPYPSVGDIGFFGAVILYIFGAFYLSKTVTTTATISTTKARLISIVVPLIILGASYTVFLKDYEYDFSAPLTTFLDFGYPLGQAIFIAIALSAFLLAKNMLGGVMRSRILLVMLALALQYAADFTFLFRFSREEYVPGDFTDFIYLLAYLVMGLALISLVSAYNAVLNGNTKPKVDATNVGQQ